SFTADISVGCLIVRNWFLCVSDRNGTGTAREEVKQQTKKLGTIILPKESSSLVCKTHERTCFSKQELNIKKRRKNAHQKYDGGASREMQFIYFVCSAQQACLAS